MSTTHTTPGPQSATAATAAPPRKALGMALGSIVVTVLAVASYGPLMEIAWVRSSGAPVWIGFALAAVLAVIAIRRDRRIAVRAVAGLTLAFIAFGVFAFFGLARLPASAAVAVGARIPSVTLPDQSGRPVALLDAAGRGPTLLVFYRGFW